MTREEIQRMLDELADLTSRLVALEQRLRALIR